jgi:hypothetical protein
VTVRILEDDDEHENEDDFSTSEFRAKKGDSGGNPGEILSP